MSSRAHRRSRSRSDGHTCSRILQQEIANRSARVLEVDVQDVESYDEELGHEIRLNTRRYQRLLSDAVKDILPEPDGDVVERDVLDVLLEQRLHNGIQASGGKSVHRAFP